MFYVFKSSLKIGTKYIARHNVCILSFMTFHTKSIKEFYRQTFERFDLNRDGLISEEDLKWTLSTLGYGDGIIALMGYKNKSHLVTTMMTALDNDKKGVVTLESFVKFIEQKCPPEDAVVQRFKDLDKNEDGVLSRDELRLSLKQQHNDIPLIVLDDLVDKQMSLYDKDKDGFVAMNEYISAWYYLDIIGSLILRATR